MGDAGPPTPPPTLELDELLPGDIDANHASLREVKVLVTGFGPFKSFLINPSWLIASTLPDELYPNPDTTSDSASPTPPTTYKIKILIHPSPIRVSYSTVMTIVPDLLAQHDPDFILHIGMAAGRDCYSLETRAHRDGYRIKDVDDGDGFSCGEVVWKREGVPDCLLVSWDEDEVLRRWEKGVEKGLHERGFLSGSKEVVPSSVSSVPSPKVFTGPMKTVWGNAAVKPMTRAEENRKKGVVKLSRDAGRFLCEYALFESLSRRWVDWNKYKQPAEARSEQQQQRRSSLSSSASAHGTSTDAADGDDTEPDREKRRLALERFGKVAFLHVPGWTGAEDVNRGAMVAEEAIRALVSSWEDGYRRDQRARASNLILAPTAAGKIGDDKKFTNQNSELDLARVTAEVAEATAAARDVGVGIEDLARVQWRA